MNANRRQWLSKLETLAAFLCLGSISPAHAEDGDWQQWTEVAWSQNLDYALTPSLRWQGRFEEDFSRFSYYEIEPMITWRYSPRWDFAVGYERDERVEPTEESSNTPNLNALLKLPMRDWDISNLFRIGFNVPESEQSEWRPVYQNLSSIKTRWPMGSRIFEPFFSEEFFLHMGEGEFIENRLSIGVALPIIPHWMGSLAFMRLDEKTPEGWQWHPVIVAQMELQF